MSESNPRGAGRKHSPPELKKIPVGVKLPRWLVEWMREQPESQAVLIEEALKKRHKLKPPMEMITAKELRCLIIAHDKGKGTGFYVPCQCLNCQSNRSKLFTLTDKESKK
jgi:hypothetical protein